MRLTSSLARLTVYICRKKFFGIEKNPNFTRIGIIKKRTVEDYRDSAKDEIYSKRVKAGKRTYFFDVKATRSNDYYLTITESKKRFRDEGFFYEKHKIFLYKEDFIKFVEALQECVDHIKEELMPDYDFTQPPYPEDEEGPEDWR